jgi:hypothetical protein
MGLRAQVVRVRPQFPKRGVHDNDPTPGELYNVIVNKLGFIDVCLGPEKFDATKAIWPNRSYCNPPFSNKRPFIEQAIASNKLGREVLIYVPFDPTTRWFRALYEANAMILIFMRKLKREKFPHALYYLRDFKSPQTILIEGVQDVPKYLMGS